MKTKQTSIPLKGRDYRKYIFYFYPLIFRGWYVSFRWSKTPWNLWQCKPLVDDFPEESPVRFNPPTRKPSRLIFLGQTWRHKSSFWNIQHPKNKVNASSAVQWKSGGVLLELFWRDMTCGSSTCGRVFHHLIFRGFPQWPYWDPVKSCMRHVESTWKNCGQKIDTFKKKLGQLLVCSKLFDWGNATFYDFASGITFLEYSLRMVEPPLWMSKEKYISSPFMVDVHCYVGYTGYIEYLLEP